MASIKRSLLGAYLAAYLHEPHFHRIEGLGVIDKRRREDFILEPHEPRLADLVHFSGQRRHELVIHGLLNVGRYHVFKLRSEGAQLGTSLSQSQTISNI